MLLLIDENVPREIGEFFRSRGHDIVFVEQAAHFSATDEALAEWADERRAIVVTFDRDFKQLAKRPGPGGQQRFKRFGRISLDCLPKRALPRLQERIESIEFEYAQTMQRGNRRFIVEITETTLRLVG
jgi:predicted nuclease of predicted toxin-antitoxin system